MSRLQIKQWARWPVRWPGLLCLAAAAHVAQAADTEAWPVAGQQGLVRFVIVPLAQAKDGAAYAQQIAKLCEAGGTCFVNFYTNSSNAPVVLPLPDAIDHEPTAVFRRSMKRGAETFRWSCRLQIEPETCF